MKAGMRSAFSSLLLIPSKPCRVCKTFSKRFLDTIFRVCALSCFKLCFSHHDFIVSLSTSIKRSKMADSMKKDKHDLNKLHENVWKELIEKLKFKEVKVPDDQEDGKPEHNSSILVSANLDTARNGKLYKLFKSSSLIPLFVFVIYSHIWMSSIFMVCRLYQ